MNTAFFLSLSSFVHAQTPNHFGPSSLTAIQRGEFLLSRSLNKEALTLYESLINKGQGDGYAFRGMVRAYKNMGKLEDAKAWIQNFLENNFDSSPTLYASGYINYLNNDIEKAEQLFNKALKFNPENALALNNLGAILLQQEFYSLAVEKVRKAIRINPKEPMFFRNLEVIYKKMGKPGLLLADYNFYLDQGPPELVRGYGIALGRNMRQMGFRLYNEGSLDSAIQKFLDMEAVYKTIKHQPGLVPVYFSLALLYEEKGDLENAKIFFNQVLMLNPLHIQAKERLKLIP